MNTSDVGFFRFSQQTKPTDFSLAQALRRDSRRASIKLPGPSRLAGNGRKTAEIRFAAWVDAYRVTVNLCVFSTLQASFDDREQRAIW